MTTHKNVHDSDSPATQPIAMSGPMDGGDILRMLYSKAQGSMTRAEKTVLADSAAECSANMGLNLAKLADEIAGKVYEDEELSGSCAYNGENLPDLLYHFSGVIKQITAMSQVSILAYDELAHEANATCT